VVSFDCSGDFVAVTDGLVALSIIPHPDLVPPTTTQNVTHALGKSVTTREAAASNGRYQLGDRFWTFPAAEGTPSLGSVLVDPSGEQWTIIDQNKEDLMALWKCTGRNLAITGNLNEYVTILKRTITKGTSGAVESSWPIWKQNVRGRLQESSSNRSEQHGRQSGTITAKVFTAVQYKLDNGYRVVRNSDGVIWEVEGYENPDSIGSLATLNVMRRV
jgi:hypothetical protein